MGETASTTDRRTQRRQDITLAAARLFARDGSRDCEMESVATDLGIANGTLYLYFKSKEELFFACVDHGMRHLQTTVQAAAETRDEPFERISEAIRAYLCYFEKFPEQVELLIQERAYFRDRSQPTYFTHRDASRSRWREVWSDLIKDGSVRDELKVEQILDFLGNLVYGTMFTNHFLGRSSSEQHAAIMDIFFRGVWSDEQRNSTHIRCQN